MGGGGSMRTVSKLAGIGVARSGFRGTSAPYPAEHSVRNASQTSSPTRLSRQGAKGAEVKPLHTAVSGDLFDWEFADEGDLFMTGGEPTPRVVFGDVPTFKEAQEATAELKEAIDHWRMEILCAFRKLPQWWIMSNKSAIQMFHHI